MTGARALVEAVYRVMGRPGGCLYCVHGTLMTGNGAHQPECAWVALRAALDVATGSRAPIPQRVPRAWRWSHGYEFSLTIEQLDQIAIGKAVTAPDGWGSPGGEKVGWEHVSPYRLLATIEVLLEELDMGRPQ